MSDWKSDFMNTQLGKLLLGIIKLAIAGLLIQLVQMFNNYSITIDIGGTTYDITAVLQIIIAFFPVLLIISAMRDIGIKI